MIDLEKIKVRKKQDYDKSKLISVNIRINKEISEWLKSNEISPTGLFYEALKEIGFKKEKII